MCLSAWVCGGSHRYPWLIAANRDEFFDREAAPMDWWQAEPHGPRLLAGRDLSAGGTWQGLTVQGRLALVTNVREPGRQIAGAPTRGNLVPQALQAPAVGLPWLTDVTRPARNGFNLMVANLKAADAYWVSNRAPAPMRLGPGSHGLSNATLDTPWPKLVGLRQRLVSALDEQRSPEALMAAAFAALADRQVPADHQLPATGLPLERERQLSSAFIHIAGSAAGGPAYGTRCSTVVIVEQCGDGRQAHVAERRFDATGQAVDERRYRWMLG